MVRARPSVGVAGGGARGLAPRRGRAARAVMAAGRHPRGSAGALQHTARREASAIRRKAATRSIRRRTGLCAARHCRRHETRPAGPDRPAAGAAERSRERQIPVLALQGRVLRGRPRLVRDQQVLGHPVRSHRALDRRGRVARAIVLRATVFPDHGGRGPGGGKPQGRGPWAAGSPPRVHARAGRGRRATAAGWVTPVRGITLTGWVTSAGFRPPGHVHRVHAHRVRAHQVVHVHRLVHAQRARAHQARDRQVAVHQVHAPLVHLDPVRSESRGVEEGLAEGGVEGEAAAAAGARDDRARDPLQAQAGAGVSGTRGDSSRA